MLKQTTQIVVIPRQSSLFVCGPCTVRIMSGEVEKLGKLLSGTNEFKNSCDHLFDSQYQGEVWLTTYSSFFIIDNYWIQDLKRYACQPIPSVQCFVSEQPYIVETLQSYLMNSKQQFENIEILDLQFSSDHFTPSNTIGFNSGPVFLCKPKTSEELLEPIWKAICQHLYKLKTLNIPVIIHTGSFKSCNDAYAQFRKVLKMFRVRKVLISDDDRCYYVHRNSSSVPFTRVAPYQNCRMFSKPAPTCEIQFNLSNVKAVVYKSIYPPESCLPLGDYVRLMKPVFLDTFELLQTGQIYGVSATTDLDPLVDAVPITGIVRVLKDYYTILVCGHVSSSEEVYLIE